MISELDSWLKQLAASGQGPVSINIDRGLPFLWRFALSGDWTGAGIKSSIRLYPDAPGETVVDFSTFNSGLSEGMTVFGVGLSPNETAGLPQPLSSSPAIFPYDLLIARPGGEPSRLFGGAVTVSQVVTSVP